MHARWVLVCDLDISADNDMAFIKCMMWDGFILHVAEDVFDCNVLSEMNH
jgi:hypothetical protein